MVFKQPKPIRKIAPPSSETECKYQQKPHPTRKHPKYAYATRACPNTPQRHSSPAKAGRFEVARRFNGGKHYRSERVPAGDGWHTAGFQSRPERFRTLRHVPHIFHPLVHCVSLRNSFSRGILVSSKVGLYFWLLLQLFLMKNNLQPRTPGLH